MRPRPSLPQATRIGRFSDFAGAMTRLSGESDRERADCSKPAEAKGAVGPAATIQRSDRGTCWSEFERWRGMPCWARAWLSFSIAQRTGSEEAAGSAGSVTIEMRLAPEAAPAEDPRPRAPIDKAASSRKLGRDRGG